MKGLQEVRLQRLQTPVFSLFNSCFSLQPPVSRLFYGGFSLAPEAICLEYLGPCGGVPERSIGAVSKTVDFRWRSVGSNPTPSAKGSGHEVEPLEKQAGGRSKLPPACLCCRRAAGLPSGYRLVSVSS
jgi:hypothetical protein